MSSSSTTKTNFKSAVTVVTSDFANTIYGGKKGSSEETAITSSSVYGQYDPRLGGHLHDGINADGHSSQIDLDGGAHVRGKLPHANLAEAAVHKINVYNDTVETNSEVIPWRTFDGTDYHYYLNLSDYTSYLSGIMTLDGVATNGNKTDQKIMLGSDTETPTAQLDVFANIGTDNVRLRGFDGSNYYSSHINVIDKLHIYNKQDGYSSTNYNEIKLYPTLTSTPSPGYVGLELSTVHGKIEIDSAGSLVSRAEMDNVVQSNRNDSGTGILIKTQQNSKIDIISNAPRTGTNPGIVVETESGSAIHIGTQTVGWSNTSEIRSVAADITFYTFGREKFLTGFSLFRTGDDYRKRAQFNADGNFSLGATNREIHRAFHTGSPTVDRIRPDGSGSISMQTETEIDNSGIGEDNVLVFDSVYYQNATSAPTIVEDHTYIKIQTPDFVNDDKTASTSNVPNHNLQSIADYTLSSSTFQDRRSSVFRFVHPENQLINNITPPASGINEAYDIHSCLVTNKSGPTHTSPNQAMNFIPTNYGYGGIGQPGYAFQVVSWMKVFVDRWNGTNWEKQLMYIPMCVPGSKV